MSPLNSQEYSRLAQMCLYYRLARSFPKAACKPMDVRSEWHYTNTPDVCERGQVSQANLISMTLVQFLLPLSILLLLLQLLGRRRLRNFTNHLEIQCAYCEPSTGKTSPPAGSTPSRFHSATSSVGSSDSSWPPSLSLCSLSTMDCTNLSEGSSGSSQSSWDTVT